MLRHRLMYGTATELVKLADSETEFFKIVMRHLGEAKKEIDNIVALTDARQLERSASCSNYTNEGAVLQIVDGEQNIAIRVDDLRGPPGKVHVGRPSNKRYHDGVEGRITRIQQGKCAAAGHRRQGRTLSSFNSRCKDVSPKPQCKVQPPYHANCG
ncbi:hypothetical protein E2562_036300 [Oryza meyeriana var. granulata]|uniref:Uncharacterized protein n=1 Tax=Oryza meyeriana var. granulata TaxID=110450 RepID=A0A6G1DSI5_9ORYZ|nr:hypothetical protein E2562_036300 [Oryza meyeriana var. granulata]